MRERARTSASDTGEAATRSMDAIARLYASSLSDFIRVRDALARELRSAGDRDAASAVRELRKPSRAAWSLNRVAHERPSALLALGDAVAAIVNAHSGRGDVRAAMTTLRVAVREYADHAAEAARAAGLSLDIAELSNVVLAVLGHPGSYDDLRAGRLTEVPAAGGLDFLTALAALPRLEVSSSASPAQQVPPTSPSLDPAEVAAAQEQARLAAEALEKARSAATAAGGVLARANSDVLEAQERLRAAESELKAALQRREFATRTNDATAAELRNAEAADRDAHRRLEGLTTR
jgi:hypothetical protein